MSSRLTPPDGARAPDAVPLERRGVLHGFVTPGALTQPDDPRTAWRSGRPIPLPGILEHGIEWLAENVADTCSMFDRLRQGSRWLDECDARVGDDDMFRYSSSTVDHADQREIERLFVDVIGTDGTRIARDLTARLSWIADDKSDESLRIRFSFGHESLREWLADADDPRSDLADAFAERVFPECALLTHPELIAMIESWQGNSIRLTERIVYSNAPGGGAVFHHDADPRQLGVLFGQLAGSTAWLALPRADLTAIAARNLGAEASSIDLDDIDPSLWTMLNMTPEFTAALADAGVLHVLGPGDAIVLPSPSAAHATWHSVFTLGDDDNLALSFGAFDAITD